MNKIADAGGKSFFLKGLEIICRPLKRFQRGRWTGHDRQPNRAPMLGIEVKMPASESSATSISVASGARCLNTASAVST